jgi:hypothetical protein
MSFFLPIAVREKRPGDSRVRTPLSRSSVNCTATLAVFWFYGFFASLSLLIAAERKDPSPSNKPVLWLLLPISCAQLTSSTATYRVDVRLYSAGLSRR